jgi:hypothetical protein
VTWSLLRRYALLVGLLVAVGCSSPSPDVRGSVARYLPEHVLHGDETRVSIILDFDDLGYVDELYYAMAELGFPAVTVQQMFEAPTGTATGEGVVASWTVDPQGELQVVIERDQP